MTEMVAEHVPAASPSNDWERERLTWPHHQHSHFVQAAGIRWHVQRMGQGQPMILLHGTGASTHSWRHVMPLLARRYSVMAIDLPGHAFTDPLSRARTSIEGISAALAELLKTLQVSPVYGVGHSAGAVILCQMVLQHDIRLRRLISLNGAFLPLGGGASRAVAPLLRVLTNTPALARWLAPRPHRAQATVTRLIAHTGSTLDDEGIGLYQRLVCKPLHVAGALRMMGNWRLHDFQESLAQVTVPMTLIVGGSDSMVPPQQAMRVRSTVRHATVRWLDGLGHLAHEEQPALLANEIVAACDSP